MAGAHWEWTDATSVHRYGLAKAPENNEWAFVLLIGAIESEFEGEKCVFDFGTGNFISGSKALYDSVPQREAPAVQDARLKSWTARTPKRCAETQTPISTHRSRQHTNRCVLSTHKHETTPLRREPQ